MPERHRVTDRFGGRRPVWVNPFHSLPARISLIVFAATLVSSLIVTAISVNSTHSFLRGKIEQKFPAILASAAERLDLWYDQRMLEIGVFANSATLVENVGYMGPASPAAARQRAHREVRQYLTSVLEGFPQYRALFLLDGNGEALLWVGEDLEVPEALRLEASRVATTGLTDLVVHQGRRLQLTSAAVMDPHDQRVGGLHAVLQLATLDGALRGSDLLREVDIFVVAPDGSYVSASTRRAQEHHFNRRLPQEGRRDGVGEYVNYDGARVVGTSQVLPRFGWTLVVEESYEHAFEPVISGIRKVLATDLAIVILLGLLAYRVAAAMVKPIEVLSDAARRISAGESDVEIPDTEARGELGLLAQAFGDMTIQLANNARELQASQREVEQALERLRDQNEELQRVNEVLEQLSVTDGLTCLHNHRFFQDYLTKEVKRAERTEEPLALILIDIDRFKRWNDRLGHSGGDEILRRVAEVMNDVVRETDLLARYGGEEFALLATNTELEGAVQLAEKIRSTIAATSFTIDPPSERDQVTVSIGVAAYSGDRRRLFDEADQALYRAKAAGRDCVMVAEHDDGGRAPADSLRRLEG